jgi:predicted GTPase
LVRGKFEPDGSETCFQLTAFDTPGIGDSQGRSKQFLNEIAQTIKTTPLNLIIILVEYGKLDVGF